MSDKELKIAVAGTGYVGLSIATLLSQYHKVTAVDIIPEKVEMINNRKTSIQDDYIEKYMAEKELDLTATLDAKGHMRMQIMLLLLHRQMSTQQNQLRSDGLWWS